MFIFTYFNNIMKCKYYFWKISISSKGCMAHKHFSIYILICDYNSNTHIQKLFPFNYKQIVSPVWIKILAWLTKKIKWSHATLSVDWPFSFLYHYPIKNYSVWRYQIVASGVTPLSFSLMIKHHFYQYFFFNIK